MSGNDELQLERAFEELRREARRAEAPERTGALLLSAFRAKQRRRRRAQWLAGAAAALVLLAVPAAVLWTARRPPAAQPAADARRGGGEFIPVAYAEPLRAGEPARVVVVRMPRDAVLQLGLPVNPARLSESIEADILLGEDNFIRAVRFRH